MKTGVHAIKIAVAAGWIFWVSSAQGAAIPLPHVTAGEAPQVAIFYDGPQTALAEGPLDARQVLNLLGHFNLTGEVIPIGDYHSGQLAKYRAAFFVGTATGTRFPAGFLDDVRNDQKPFAWISRHLDSLLDTTDSQRRFGFRYLDYRDDLEFREVSYKGVTLPKEDPDLNLVSILDPAAVQILATARNEDRESYPYALHHGRFWYFADIPFSFAEEGGRYLVFCDLLHDVLEIQHPASSMALVRLEDVSTDIDGGDLREIADRMARLKVPFQIAVIPVFRKPSQGIEVRLTDRPSFVEALQYAIARGGTPIMHGITHQYQGTTADDYEFWNAVENRPVTGDSADYVLKRLRLGFGEMFAAGIYPVAFETPHYAASETDYTALKTAFALFYERTMATPDLGSVQYFPYPVVDDFGRTVLPENLGYLPEDNPDPQVLIQRARSLQVVRDGIASFYFHPFLNPALLERAVQGIAALGYHFISLREFGGGLSFEGRWVVATASGPVRIAPSNEYWRLRVFDGSGALLREQLSEGRNSGPVEVAVEVPAGGWASVECLKELPHQPPLASWSERVSAWLGRLRSDWAGQDQQMDASARSAWILWLPQPGKDEANNQQSYRSALQTFGYRVRPVNLAEFSALPPQAGTILVVPEGAASHLTGKQVELILKHLDSGGGVIADGHQAWLSRIGFQWSGRRIPVNRVVDVLFPEMPLRWRPEELVERFEAPQGARQLMVDPESRQTLALAGNYGPGSYLYLASPLDPHTPEASSHYPYFAEYLEEAFPRRTSLRSARLEVYFDPGYRQNVDLARLAAMWRQNGIRTIYAAAWQLYPGYEFDYDRLIRLAHQNGIAVYAWFVLPQATPKLWAEHPEWRERTATGADGNVGWRLLMNLENPDCFRAAMDWVKTLLAAHDWDGVNLAELNYDADFQNYLRPDRFVPMNAEVRAAFAAKAGFDPALLFAPGSPYSREKNPAAWKKFLAFREDLVTELHRRVLQALAPMQKERGWEIVVTMLDSLHSQSVGLALGVNSARIAALMKEFDFTLQVEDPAEHWAGSADRYRQFAATYLPLVPDRQRLMFDINVMADRAVDATTLPSQLLTGTELARTVLAAASASGRVALYSESTVASQDWEILGQALASEASMEASRGVWKVNAPLPVRLLPAQNRPYYLDGSYWPAATVDGVLIPPGQHELALTRPWYRFLDRGEMQTSLLNFSANLEQASASPTGIALRYNSPTRTVILLNQPPQEIRLEGEPADLPVQSAAGRWWLIAPRGEHSVEIITASQTGVVLNVWSWLSASAISAYGALVTLLMAGIYAYIRVRRLVHRKGATG